MVIFHCGTTMSSLALLARALPDHVHAELLSRLANHLMKGQEIRTRLNEIEGQRICIAAIDSGRSPVFILRNGHLERCAEEAWTCELPVPWQTCSGWRAGPRIQTPCFFSVV